MAATAPSAFVGRETELARLTAALEAAAQGRAPAIIVEGESGAGKTRLLREFAAVAARRGATVLFGRCIDCGEAGPPYWPFIEALRSLPGSDERATSGGAARGGRPDADRAGTDAGGAARGGRPDADRAGTDAGGAARGGRPDADERAEPGTGAGGDRADADEGAEAGTSGGRDRAGFFERVLDRLEVSGRRSLVALLLDDLHWADRSTRDLLGFLLANLAGGPGPLVVATVRSEALVPGHPLVPLLAELRRSRRAEFLTLDRLGKGDVAAQLTSILGETPDPELLDEIWRRSEGNPFFVEELLAAARSGHELTSTLAPILAARLGALSPGARTAAGAVAASVGPVPHRILVQVAGVAEPALLAGLRECVDHHVLVADVRAGTYSFRHSLLREAAYAGLLPGEATRLHAAYGHALSATLGHVRPYAPLAAAEHPGAGDSGPGGATGGEATQLAAVAWHFYAAGDAERALPAALAAAVAAEAACGYAEAHVQYERALELAGRLPPEALELAFLTAAGPPSGTPVPEGGRLEGGGSLEGAGAEPAFLTAAGASSGTPVGDGSFDWVALAERAGEAAQLGGDPARAVVLLRLALAAARPEQASRLHLALGAALWAAGDSTGALSAYDAAIRHLSDPETAEAVRAAAAAAEARMLAGRYGESRRLAEDALALARRLGLPLEEAEILGTLGVDLAVLGEAGPAVAAL
ncbi:MAG TPA: AAA family ATPase, partial [Acidimicrobiia bacterium]|nr:AAA family ATPase [Acidimicrobiia bacterium]